MQAPCSWDSSVARGRAGLQLTMSASCQLLVGVQLSLQQGSTSDSGPDTPCSGSAAVLDAGSGARHAICLQSSTQRVHVYSCRSEPGAYHEALLEMPGCYGRRLQTMLVIAGARPRLVRVSVVLCALYSRYNKAAEA